jgi:hypothetical protein
LSKPSFTLAILFNAAEGVYKVLAHNQIPEEAARFRGTWNPHLIPGVSLITLEQHSAQTTDNAQSCRTCRRTVRGSSGLQPLPKFQRREV